MHTHARTFTQSLRPNKNQIRALQKNVIPEDTQCEQPGREPL